MSYNITCLSLLILFCSTLTFGREFPCVIQPCAIKNESLRFFVIGDWGGKSTYPYTTDTQFRVADGLATLDRRKNVHFYISTGDHFYNGGVKNMDDVRFMRTFENVYDRNAHQKPWYLIAGNHDHNGNVSAQISYSNKSQRWNFPSKFYSFSYKISKKLLAEFIMVDTVELCGQLTDDTSAQNMDSVKMTSYQQRKWEWINNQLNSSNASYLFVVGHYPVTSAGFHGPNGCMIKYMKPMLDTHRVNGYLAGHDHNLQHLFISESNWTVNYVVSGFGSHHDSYERSKRKLSPAKLSYFFPEKSNGHYNNDDYNSDRRKGGFVYGELNESFGKLSLRDGDGKELHIVKLTPR